MNSDTNVQNDQSIQPEEERPADENDQQENYPVSPMSDPRGTTLQDPPMSSGQEMITGSETREDWVAEPHADDPRQRPAMRQPATAEKINLKDRPSNPEQGEDTPLSVLTRDEITDLHSRWNTIQVQFVDSPCSAVEQGDALVAEVVEKVKQAISDRQQALNQLWLNHDDISTEELRVTLRNYRSMLEHLLGL